MTPSGGNGFVRAIGPNGEKNVGLTGQRIPGGSYPQPAPAPAPQPYPNPLPPPPTPEDLAKKYPAPIPIPEDLQDLQNLIKPVNLVTGPEKGTVLSPNGVNTRTGPGTANPLVAKNDAWLNTTVTILEKGLAKSPGSMAEWWKIITPGGSTGYTQAIDPSGKPLIKIVSGGGVISA